MIEAVVFLPHPPVLVPELAQGATSELAELRAACAAACDLVITPDRTTVLIGAGDGTHSHALDARGTFAGFGVPLEVSVGDGTGPVDLPLSLTVGCWLVGRGRAYSIGPDAAAPVLLDEPTTLVVMGDGSARRDVKAPGYLDERAAGYDKAVVAALASGDPGELGRLDLDLGADLLAAGAPVWRAAAALLTRSYTGSVLHDSAPFGVGYFVAAWT
jgi:hypothetical protein